LAVARPGAAVPVRGSSRASPGCQAVPDHAAPGWSCQGPLAGCPDPLDVLGCPEGWPAPALLGVSPASQAGHPDYPAPQDCQERWGLHSGPLPQAGPTPEWTQDRAPVARARRLWQMCGTYSLSFGQWASWCKACHGERPVDHAPHACRCPEQMVCQQRAREASFCRTWGVRPDTHAWGASSGHACGVSSAGQAAHPPVVPRAQRWPRRRRASAA
jgi:hypothetical protein